MRLLRNLPVKWSRILPILFVGFNLVSGVAFAQQMDPSQLGIQGFNTNFQNILQTVAKWLTLLTSAATIVMIAGAIKHGMGIAHETDPRARQEKIKGLGGWIIGGIVMFAAAAITGAVWALSGELGK